MASGIRSGRFVRLKTAFVACFMLTGPATALEEPNRELLGALKQASGYAGALAACNDTALSADAIRLYMAMMEAGIKHGYLAEDYRAPLEKFLKQHGRETRALFQTAPPMPCDQVERRYIEFRRPLLGE